MTAGKGQSPALNSHKNAQRIEQLKRAKLKKIYKLKKKLCLESYYFFFKEFWDVLIKDDYVDNWHVELLCNKLQKLGERVIKRENKEHDLLINISPSESKSTICTVFFPVWLWLNDPTIRVMSASYTMGFSIEHAGFSRDIIRSARFQAMFGDRVQIRKDRDNKLIYYTTQGGWRKSASVGSQVTGSHAHIILIDDPLNPQQAASEALLEKANNWIEGTLSTRNTNFKVTPQVVVMQRLHEDDPSGRFIERMNKGEKIDWVCLPAENKNFEVFPKKYNVLYKDGLMNPKRKDWEILDSLKLKMGETAYSAQLGQIPRSFRGNIVKTEQLPVVSFGSLGLNASTLKVEYTLDTAYTKKTQNDPSSCLAYFVHRGILYVYDYLRVWEEITTLTETLTDFVTRTKGTNNYKMSIEPKASGLSVYQALRYERVLNVSKYKLLEGDKIARLNGVLRHLETDKVRLIKGAWNDQFIDECLNFPNGKHDEAIDTLVMALDLSFNKKPFQPEHWETIKGR